MPLMISRGRRTAAAGIALAAGAAVTVSLATPSAAAPAAPAAGSPAIGSHASAGASAPTHVIVIGRHGALPTVAADVAHLGGRVTVRLPIIDGVAATVPGRALAALRRAAGVRSVSRDARGHLMGINQTLGYDTAKDDGSMQLIEQTIHAQDAWKKGYTGKGVDVALIDSGVSPVDGLNNGNVVNGPDLSFDSQYPNLTDLDGFGHGTHLASIIAGRDFSGSPAQYASNNSQYLGVAPDARIISLKVASADGSADVSQVIAALNWVDEHAQSNGLNIRVVNLSFGTESTQPYTIDPLAYAAEQAWRHGVVVVVSGGNDGTSRPTLTDPAYDPNLLAVGASDPNGDAGPANDRVAGFSSVGSASRSVDVVAPGVHVLGLRDPGSYVDQNNPGAVVGTRFIRGSGTSQAAAVVSGAVALLAQRYPNATPDQLRAMLMATAMHLKGAGQSDGSGEINVDAAIAKGPLDGGVLKLLTLLSNPAAATGSGSLDAARGGVDVVDDQGNGLTGEQDIFGHPWNSSAWSAAVAAKTAWGADGTFNGNVWTGTDFSGQGWATATWASVPWTASSWSGDDWASHHWTSHHWTDQGWTGAEWDDAGWNSHHWTGSEWDSWSWG
jgi:serine protease AprX